MTVKMHVFTMRIDDEDRAVIADLARRLRRSQSDALRIVAREALASLQGAAPEGLVRPVSVNIPHPAEPAQVSA
jgi:hypothetical protein